MNSTQNSIEKILISENEINEAVKQLSSQINSFYGNEPLILVIILKGSLVFASDLMKHLEMPVVLDFVQASSYGSKTESNGNVLLKKDLDCDIKDKNVLIVEDIIDSGNTLYKIKNNFLNRGPKSLKICTLLDKPQRRTAHISADFTGVVVPDEFLVGYGLDYNEYFRNLTYIGILKRNVYEK